MLELVHRLAVRLYPWRQGLLVLGAAGLFGFLFLLFSGNQALDVYLLPSAALLGWAACLYGMATGFRQIPATSAADDPWLVRLKQRLKRALAWLLSSVFVVISAGLLFISLRAISLGMQAG